MKSKISDNSDILRGLFQCIKYRALIEADQKLRGFHPDCRAILALESEFPKGLLKHKNTLGIEVIDQINVHRI